MLPGLLVKAQIAYARLDRRRIPTCAAGDWKSLCTRNRLGAVVVAEMCKGELNRAIIVS